MPKNELISTLDLEGYDITVVDASEGNHDITTNKWWIAKWSNMKIKDEESLFETDSVE